MGKSEQQPRRIMRTEVATGLMMGMLLFSADRQAQSVQDTSVLSETTVLAQSLPPEQPQPQPPSHDTSNQGQQKLPTCAERGGKFVRKHLGNGPAHHVCEVKSHHNSESYQRRARTIFGVPV